MNQPAVYQINHYSTEKTWLSTLPCALEVVYTVMPKFRPPHQPPSKKKTNCFPRVATCNFSSEFKREPPYICAGLIRGLLRTMVINHPLKKSRIFLVFFFWKHLWICMMNKNHFEGRVFNKLSRNRYLSVLVEYYELPSLQGTISYTYPASSGCRKIIFQKGGDILVPGRVVLNQATRSWNEDNSRSKLGGKKPTTQLYHLESRWRSPRNIGFRQSAWGHSTCGHLHHHDEYKVPTASRWSNDQGLQALHDLGNIRKWNQRLVGISIPVPQFTRLEVKHFAPENILGPKRKPAHISWTGMQAWNWLMVSTHPKQIWKSNWKSSPIFGVNIKKYVSCHHLGNA